MATKLFLFIMPRCRSLTSPRLRDLRNRRIKEDILDDCDAIQERRVLKTMVRHLHTHTIRGFHPEWH